MIDSHRFVATMLATLLLLALGCASDRPAADAANPAPFSLSLKSVTSDRRYTYFELTKAGELSFGGGRDGAQMIGSPVATLTEAQRAAVWKIIEDNKLLEAKDHFLGKGEQVTYDLKLKAGGLGRSVHTFDNETPGLRELHELLFNIQSGVRYNLPGVGGQFKAK